MPKQEVDTCETLTDIQEKIESLQKPEREVNRCPKLNSPASSAWGQFVASHSAIGLPLSHCPPQNQQFLKLSYFELSVSVF